MLCDKSVVVTGTASGIGWARAYGVLPGVVAGAFAAKFRKGRA
jgi:NAD(P)-dependent dehydrogenase (short-subunit alcohol dehydrogenase family)